MKKVCAAQAVPTAIISGSHDLSKGILRAVHEKGLSIPGDVSIISYDNIPATESFEVPLSTVGVPLHTITEKLADVVMRLISEEKVKQNIYLEPELKITESCQTRRRS